MHELSTVSTGDVVSTTLMVEGILGDIRLFSDLDPREISRLALLFEERRMPSGRRIYKSGDPSDALYIVRQGSVAIYSDKPGKPVHLQARLGPGDFFGELGLFDGFERSASARTNEDSRLLVIPKETLLPFLDDHPALALKLQIAAARRHSHNVSLALDLSQRKDLRIRLDLPVDVILEDGSSRHMMLENLSLGGLCLQGAPESWQRHWTLRFDMLYAEHRLPVIGRVTWRRDHTIGLAFSRVDPEHENHVQDMLRRLLEDTVKN